MNNKRRQGSNKSTAVKITVGGKEEVITERRSNIIIDHSSTSSSSSTNATICGRDNNNNNNNNNNHNDDDKIILSLHNEQYKSIMWKYFNVLGKTKTTIKNITNEEEAEREEVIGKEILALFKQRQDGVSSSSNSSVITATIATKFYKQRYKNGALEEVNENVALESKLFVTYYLFAI